MTEPTEWRFGKTDNLPDGPWKSEPDKVSWIDDATGLDCLIVRNQLGALCGYVGLPPEHPKHGTDYDAIDYNAVDVHGGLTFSSSCDEERPEGICHVPQPGRPKNVWWFGFDCSHHLDLVPYSVGKDWEQGKYRDVAYVTAEVTSLARQLAVTP